MTVKISKKIVSCEVVEGASSKESKELNNKVQQTMTNVLLRPEKLTGSTYKIKPPVLDHSIFVTINDIKLEDGSVRPFEIFINSKNLEGYQWIIGITRMISALLRHNIDPFFLVDELKQVFDPKDSYYLPGGVFVKSIVAHLGILFYEHCTELGLTKDFQLSENQKRVISKKKEELKTLDPSTFSKEECPKCSGHSYVNTGGCPVCLDCGYSKCS